MKKMLIVFAVAAAAVSCKSKTAESLDTQKEMVVTYPAYNNSYSTDQGDMGKATTVSKNLPKTYGTSSSNNTSVSNKASTSNSSTAVTTTKTTTKKKGWSGAAKGTVIGAGSGAIIGAIVSKKKGAGAIIGGLIGAGAGYAVGNESDKKKRRNN